MELNLTSEQTLLRDSAAKFIAASGPKVARGFRGKEISFAPERLREAGELGWLGILVPASADGLGLGLTELALVLEQAGRGLVCEPIGLAAISAAALAHGKTPHPMLERAVAGQALVVPALQEGAHDSEPLAPKTQAAEKSGALRLTGQKVSSAPTVPTAFWSARPDATVRSCATSRATRRASRSWQRRPWTAAGFGRSGSPTRRPIPFRPTLLR